MPFSEDFITQLGPGEMRCNAYALANQQTSFTGIDIPPLCTGGGVLEPDHIGFLIPVHWHGAFLCDGFTLGPDDIYFNDSPNGYFTRGEKRSFFGITIERQSFYETVSALHGIFMEDLKLESHCLTLPRGARSMLVAKLSVLSGSQGHGDPESLSREKIGCVLNDVYYTILDAFLASKKKKDYPEKSFKNNAMIVRKTEEAFLGNQKLNVSLADLCKTTGVSKSALYRAFDDLVGVPPLQYFRARRLNVAHSNILAKSYRKGVVRDIATDQGFTELGRFSSEYKKIFGLTPLASIRRDSSEG